MTSSQNTNHDTDKILLVSGKMNGSKTLEGELKDRKDPDEIEQFFIQFLDLKLTFDLNNKIIYLNDDQDFLDNMAQIEKSKYIGLYPTSNFSRLYLTTDEKITYIIRLKKVSNSLVANLISREEIIKFALNSFTFIKWCNAQKIDMKNIYDIPTYIKILTNHVDPFKTIEDYILQYTNYELLSEDIENNSIIIGNFIYEFGVFLNSYIEKFDLTAVNKLINENSYYEGKQFDNVGNCKFLIRYKNIAEILDPIIKEKELLFKERAYVLSPLNRIALSFHKNMHDLLKELYFEDISIMALNELYNNNIPVQLQEDDSFFVTCKYKNFSNILSILTAILNDIFYTLFNHNAVLSIDCEIRE